MDSLPTSTGDGRSLPEIDPFIGHAQAALHYPSRAGQFIDLSLNRMALAAAALKKSAATPNKRLTPEVWGAGIATCANSS